MFWTEVYEVNGIYFDTIDQALDAARFFRVLGQLCKITQRPEHLWKAVQFARYDQCAIEAHGG